MIDLAEGDALLLFYLEGLIIDALMIRMKGSAQVRLRLIYGKTHRLPGVS